MEPVVLCDPEGDGTEFHVSFMALYVGGQGLAWPWTYEELVNRLQGSEAIQRLMQVCHETWPVPWVEVGNELIHIRKKMGRLWGGADFDAPLDWRWAIQESY